MIAFLETAAIKPVLSVRVRWGRVEVFDRIAGIDPEVWASLFAPHWKDYRYYQTIEETLTEGFEQRYLVLRDTDGDIRAIQPFFTVAQDLTVSLPAAIRGIVRFARSFYASFLRLRLLMVGCIVGECQIGVGERPDWRWLCPAIDEALALCARRERVSIIIFKDTPAEMRSSLALLRTDSLYARLPSLPALRLPLDFGSFNEYLETRLGKATRKSLRRKFRDFERAGASITLEVKNTVTEDEAAEVHRLYDLVARRGDHHFEVFSKDYFLRLSERMPDQTHFFIWRMGERIVAFNFCMVCGDEIHDNDIGYAYPESQDLHLYYVTYRGILEWALARGLKSYSSGPFNYEPKLRLGMKLAPLDLYVRHTSPWIQPLLRWFAPLLEPTRQDPALGEFANYSEVWG